jgi:quercetin dioxygenase-like cupin family protein
MSFESFELTHGLLRDLRDGPFPSIAWSWVEDALSLADGATHFGFVHAGPATLDCAAGTFVLRTGMYFAVPGPLTIAGERGLVVSRLGHRGFFHVGGPIEGRGRLRYIDGCTDSLLVPPVLRGDPCLNLLHLPPSTQQTPHTHPSVRVGLVVRGAGSCVTPEKTVALAPGRAFVIRADALHCFHTGPSELLVLAYHPESDFGPTHEDHPMINRTRVRESESLEA